MRYLSSIITRDYDPIRCIEWVIAIFTFAGGVYLFSPLYEISVKQYGVSSMAAALTYPLVLFLFGSILLIGAAFIIIGLWKNMPQVKSAGLFMIILARFFQILTVLLVSGPLPLTWIYPLTVTAVCIVLWVNTRVRIRNAS